MSYLGFQDRNLRVQSCTYVVTAMSLKLFHVGELCGSVPLHFSSGVRELLSPALVFLMHLGFPWQLGKQALLLRSMSSSLLLDTVAYAFFFLFAFEK